MTRFYMLFSLTCTCFFMQGALSDERAGLYFTVHITHWSQSRRARNQIFPSHLRLSSLSFFLQTNCGSLLLADPTGSTRYPDTTVSPETGSLVTAPKHVAILIKTRHRNRLNYELVLIMAFAKIRPRIEALECQKRAQSTSHNHIHNS
jgi:hypothetical protein